MTLPPSCSLSEIQLDALTELVNLGVSRAALGLREMVGAEILLSVPKVAIIEQSQAEAIVGGRDDGELVAVHQQFEGDITGRALLIFPERQSLELVRAVTSRDLPLEEIVELEQEALAETGNVILNSCLSTIANQLQRSLTVSLPEILRGRSAELFGGDQRKEDSAALFIYINFSVSDADITGYIAMLTDLPSIAALKGLIDDFILRATDGAHA